MEHNGDIIRKQRHKRRQIIINVFYIILIVLVYSLVLIAQIKIQTDDGINICGYQFYTISSESMKPEINKGDIFIVKKCESSQIQEGDIITFELNNDIVTHRIEKIDDINGVISYTTKGDNNEVEDSTNIYYEQIIGKKVNVISNFGNIVLILNNKAVLIFIVLIILLMLNKIRRNSIKSKNRREKKKIEDKKYIEQ